MGLQMAEAAYEDMLSAARRAAPLEACGLLAGQGRRITKCYELTNADGSAEHFSMIPSEQFAAVKDMRGQGLQMLAIWHSHPSSPPRMSEEDLRLAFTPNVAYVVLSLATPQRPAACAYRIEDGEPKQIEIVIDGAPKTGSAPTASSPRLSGHGCD